MTSKEIRQKYLEFFKARGHKIIPSASLIPENDSSTLFVSSGMQPLVPYLLGEKHPEGIRLADSQKSFRAQDIEEVGDSRHNTFFEMLGNWSLGDYFKKEQLSWNFEFLTGELGIDPNRLYVTVYRGNEKIGIPKDTEAVEIWKELFKSKGIEAKDIDMPEEIGVPEGGRIFYYPDKKNWWSRSGTPDQMPAGEPGGPDSEVFYDMGADLKRHENSIWKDQPCHLNCDCGRFIEINNNVFMEFLKTENGFTKLKQRNVDFGGGLERITMVSQNKTNVFETDLFINILNKISLLAGGKEYQNNTKEFEIIADHLKAATFIMADDKGIKPSNTGQGYIVRRLIRRAIRFGKELGIVSEEGGWTKEIAKIVAHDYSGTYPELSRNINSIIDELKKEEEKFNKTLEEGLKILNKKLEAQIGVKGQPYTSIPVHLVQGPNNIQMWDIAPHIITGKWLFDFYQTFGFPLEMIIEELKTRGYCFSEKDYEKLNEDFDIELKKHQELSRTASAGTFKGGLADASEETKKLHTAAHLLLAALRTVLGDHVFQKGSNITAERLRFDFSHPDKMSEPQIREAEKIVNDIISQDLTITCEELPLAEAKEKGAMGVFESKYGEKVKVYKIGSADDKPFSYEICGGPHAEHTGQLGKFKIVKEESSSSGVRRIKAVLE